VLYELATVVPGLRNRGDDPLSKKIVDGEAESVYLRFNGGGCFKSWGRFLVAKR
jgi:hypothetical protein